MSEVMLVDAPVRFPTACVCGNQSGPMVDTMIENACGHVYLCEKCVRRAAVACGWSSPETLASLGEGYEALVAENQRLWVELEHEKAHKLVDAAEFSKHLVTATRSATTPPSAP